MCFNYIYVIFLKSLNIIQEHHEDYLGRKIWSPLITLHVDQLKTNIQCCLKRDQKKKRERERPKEVLK